MYTLNMIEHAELYRNERLREAANARMRKETLAVRPTPMLVMLGEGLTGLGGMLTALGAYLVSNRSA